MIHLIEFLPARCYRSKLFRTMHLSDDLRALEKVSRVH